MFPGKYINEAEWSLTYIKEVRVFWGKVRRGLKGKRL
jgi:hypothetical protein